MVVLLSLLYTSIRPGSFRVTSLPEIWDLDMTTFRQLLHEIIVGTSCVIEIYRVFFVKVFLLWMVWRGNDVHEGWGRIFSNPMLSTVFVDFIWLQVSSNTYMAIPQNPAMYSNPLGSQQIWVMPISCPIWSSDDNTYNFRKFQTQLSSIWIDLDGGNPPSSHTPDRPNRRSAGRCRIVEIPCTSKYHSIYRNAMHECKHLDVFRQMN